MPRLGNPTTGSECSPVALAPMVRRKRCAVAPRRMPVANRRQRRVTALPHRAAVSRCQKRWRVEERGWVGGTDLARERSRPVGSAPRPRLCSALGNGDWIVGERPLPAAPPRASAGPDSPAQHHRSTFDASANAVGAPPPGGAAPSHRPQRISARALSDPRDDCTEPATVTRGIREATARPRSAPGAGRADRGSPGGEVPVALRSRDQWDTPRLARSQPPGEGVTVPSRLGGACRETPVMRWGGDPARRLVSGPPPAAHRPKAARP
jgi:hypothetical protein